MDLSQILQSNGFTQKEAIVYLASLEIGMAPASVIARKAGLPRSSCYEMLLKLSAKGYAEFFVKKSTRYYSVVPPKLLLQKLSNNMKHLADSIPEFTAIQNDIVHKPKISFYEGKEDLRRIYIDVIEATGLVLNYFHPEAAIAYFGEEWLKKEMMDRIEEKKMDVRVIMPDTLKARLYLKARESVIRKQRIAQGSEHLFRNEVVIYEDTVMHFSYEDDFAFLIKSKHVAETHRSIFNLAWESSLLE